MPRIKIIDGVEIKIWPNDHNPPHFHVLNVDFYFAVDIENFEIISGQYNRKAEKVLNWARENKVLIQESWEKINE